MSDDLARDYESLLQFVYQFPVAVLRIGGSGAIDLLTPRLVVLLHGLGLSIDPASGWALLAALDGPLAEQARAAMSSPGAVVRQRAVDFRDPRGRMHHLSLSVLITGVDACMVVIEDVTQRVEQERQLTIQQRNLAVVLESIEGYLVASLDLDLRVIQANRSIERMLGLGTEVVGRPWAALFARDGADAPDLRALADEALGQGWSNFEAEYAGADGGTLWCDTHLTTVVDESGEASQFVAVGRDVSARRRREVALVEQALSDPLTGLVNRRGLATHLQSWRDAADPARPATLTAIALDLDFFRLVNEAHGHDGGDEVLRALSRTITQQFRRDDLVVRLGGEEFLVVLRDTPDDRAAALAERLRERVAGTSVPWRDASIAVTVSLGVATRDFHGDVEALLRDADLALYRAKAEGRNRVARG